MRLINELPTPVIPDDFKQITIRWPGNKTGIPFPVGKWQRLPDGRIEARYTRQELELIYNLGLLISSPTEKAG